MALVEAAQQGVLSEVQRLLGTRGTDINATKRGAIAFGGLIAAENATPLIAAAGEGHLEVCRTLLDAGADLEKASAQGDRPLAIAAATGRVEILELLLSRGARIGAANTTGDTALHFAVRLTQLPAVRFLLGSGAPLEARDQFGSTPLHWAVQLAGPSSVPEGSALDYLAQYHKVSAAEMRERLLARDRDAATIVELLLRAGAGPNTPNKIRETPFHLAVSKGDVTTAALLLAHGGSVEHPATHGDTVLHLASDDPEMTRLLLARGANPNQKNRAGETPALAAAESGNAEVLSLLARAGADLSAASKKGRTPASVVARSGDLTLAGILAEFGPGLASPESEALLSEALCLASKEGDTTKVAELLAQGASPRPGRNTEPALWLAAGAGHPAVVKLLLSSGAPVDSPGPDGTTPLHRACERGDAESALLLIEAGAKIDTKTGGGEPDRRGAPPLLLACQSGSVPIVERLLAAGARVNVRTAGGLTPLLASAMARGDRIVELLKEAGAREGPLWPHFEEALALRSRLKTPSFSEAIRLVESACGTTARRIDSFQDGVLIDAGAEAPDSPLRGTTETLKEAAARLAAELGGGEKDAKRMGRRASVLLPSTQRLHSLVLQSGPELSRLHSSLVLVSMLPGDMLALVPTTDPLAIVASLGPAPEGLPAMVSRLSEFATRFPFQVHGAGGATLILRFSTPCASREALAKDLLAFGADETGVIRHGVHFFATRQAGLEELLRLEDVLVRLWWD